MKKPNKRNKKEFLLSELVCHALLSLYIDLAYSDKFVPTVQRTNTLIKRLKLLIQLDKYKPVKSEIRQLIHFGRNTKEDLELKLVELNDLRKTYTPQGNSDLAKFRQALQVVTQHCEIELHTDIESVQLSNNKLLFDKEQVVTAFDSMGNLISPIQVYIPTTSSNIVADKFEKMGWLLLLGSLSLPGYTVADLKLSNEISYP